ncbi:MAG: hypothetical protein J7480_02035 [Microbacteriaceae bacterium]|nr:hypothetical protein [Microbacteriaceae bacterium]
MSPKPSPKAAKTKSRKEPKAPSKSKLIKDARKSLEKALKEHAEIAAGSGVALKKAQRASAKLAAAAAAYADAVQAKTGLESPFIPGNGKLDGETIKSLEAEREAIEHAVTGQIPVIAAAAEAPADPVTPATEPAPAAPAKAPARRAAATRTSAPRTTTPRTTAARSTTARTTTAKPAAEQPAASPAPRRRTATPKPDAE